jgi:peptidoglycan/xylan/chitin deacetylase (PgdA/CDA1 family)
LQDYSADTRYLSCSELINIGKSGIIDFGCHGLTHEALSRLDIKQLDEEILGARHKLEYLTHNKIDLFAYPFGHSKSYNANIIKKVKDAGFIGAFTAIFGLNRFDTDPFLIRRNCISWLDELDNFEKHLMGAYDWYALFEYFRPKRYHC